jgi:hypothetical protein
MALMPLKAGRLNEGLRGGLMVGGSNAWGVASRGAEWRPEVAGCGGGTTKLRRSQRKVMIGGAHLSAGAQRGVKAARAEAFPLKGGGNREGRH